MARIRSVHPDICESIPLADISASAERTFVRLWTACDDEGRAKADPRILKAKLYPVHSRMSITAVDRDLAELETAGLIVRYCPNGTPLLQVCSWDEYQHPNRPTPSKFPAPSRRLMESSVSAHDGLHAGVETGVEGSVHTRGFPTAITITESLRAWALSHGFDEVDLTAEFEKCVDWHRANGKPRSDWDATMRNWLKKGKQFGTLSTGDVDVVPRGAR